ncbi:MAG: hypothetical protein ACYCZN_09665 [Candidatus Dormibacteria bacterium]
MSTTKALAAAHAAAWVRLEMAVTRLAGDKDITDRAATLAELREAQDEVVEVATELRALKALAAEAKAA